MAATAREVKKRIQSVKNIAQITRALQAVSASKVQRAVQAVEATRPYASKAWEVLTHLAQQPGRNSLHPLLTTREQVQAVAVILVTADRGLAGPYNTNVLRTAFKRFDKSPVPVKWITVGRKGREMLLRMGHELLADFSGLPDKFTFVDTSAIGRLAVDEFLEGRVDEVYIVYTDFISFLRQEPRVKKLLPLEVEAEALVEAEFVGGTKRHAGAYIYEPDQQTLLDEIVPRFIQLQVYQALLESRASEHAARMVAMKKATDNATELADVLQLEYNKARQQGITRELMDIVGGAEALRKSEKR
ncbi:MAG: ATP synthase F1 subunit gamma [Chloroflexi bacterium]|nr:ATP synthase F1 subunit gamma [Chloroflexota bacterium]